jgi:hypothetical protein
MIILSFPGWYALSILFIILLGPIIASIITIFNISRITKIAKSDNPKKKFEIIGKIAILIITWSVAYMFSGILISYFVAMN